MTANGETAKALFLRLTETTRKRLDQHTANINKNEWPPLSQTKIVERMLVQALDAIDAAAKKAAESKQLELAHAKKPRELNDKRAPKKPTTTKKKGGK